MNPVDWAIVVVLVYSTVRAALRGLIRVLFSLVGAVAGFVVAAWYYRALAPRLSGLVTSPQLQLLVAFALLLFGVALLFGLVGLVVHRASHAVGLGALNRLAGAAFGLVRGVVFCAGVVTGLLAFLPAAPWLAQSTLTPYLLRGVRVVSFGMPRDMQVRLAAAAERVKHAPGDWIKSTR